ncbi:MAG: DUF2239 family protein [Dyella sp.]
MDATPDIRCTAFDGSRLIASGELAQVALKVKQVLEHDARSAVMIFDDATSEVLQIDFRGSQDDLVQRLSGELPPSTAEPMPAPTRSRGRPRLGVVAREITLLPKHWDWLNCQPGGASVALRRLVDEARRLHLQRSKDRQRRAQEVTFRFIQRMANHQPRYDDLARALFAADHARFLELLASWPDDLREHVRKLATDAFATADDMT